MYWRKSFSAKHEGDIWYIYDRATGTKIAVASKFEAVMEAMHHNIAGSEALVAYLVKRGQNKMIADCMVAEFMIEYQGFLQMLPDVANKQIQL